MAFHVGKEEGGKRSSCFCIFFQSYRITQSVEPKLRACSLLANGNENCIHNVRWTSWHRPYPRSPSRSSPLAITKCDLECAVAAAVVMGRLSLLWRANKSGSQRNMACHKLTNVNGRHIAPKDNHPAAAWKAAPAPPLYCCSPSPLLPLLAVVKGKQGYQKSAHKKTDAWLIAFAGCTYGCICRKLFVNIRIFTRSTNWWSRMPRIRPQSGNHSHMYPCWAIQLRPVALVT